MLCFTFQFLSNLVFLLGAFVLINQFFGFGISAYFSMYAVCFWELFPQYPFYYDRKEQLLALFIL